MLILATKNNLLKKCIIFVLVVNAFGIDHLIFKDEYNNINLNLLHDPFFFKEQKIKHNFSLQAIISNKAKIDGKWYFINDEIDGFKISKIEQSQVILTKKQDKMVLNLYEKNHNIIIH